MGSLCSPASIIVLAPKRSERGIGTPVPRSVTRKSRAELMLSSINDDAFVADEIGPPLEIVSVRVRELLWGRADHAMAVAD